MRRVLWILLFASLGAASEASAWAQTQAADPELNKGIQLVEEGDFDGGVRTLSAVVKRLQTSGGAPRDLTRANLYLGIAHVSLRNESVARAAFVEALRADPTLTLSADEFPPRVIAAFQLAKRDVPTGPASPRPTSTPPPSASTTTTLPRAPTTSPTVFLEAVKAGDFATVRTLLTEDAGLLNAKDTQFGASALHWSALRGHTAIAALLLDRGANFSVRNNDGETPMIVAERSKRADIVRLLRDAGATASGGPLTIFEAAKLGDATAVRKLLDEHAGLLNLADTGFGATALHWAALRGHVDVVRVLLEKGADTNIRNSDGETALQVAERAKRNDIVQLLRGRAAPGGGSLIDAVRDGDLARVQQLLAANPGALNQKDASFGATPLHWAALRGHAEVARFLLAQGGDATARNKDGETPLQVAQRSKRGDVISVFQSGAAPPVTRSTPAPATPPPAAPPPARPTVVATPPPATPAPPPVSSGPVNAATLVEAVKAGDLTRVRGMLGENPGLINAKDAQFGASLLHWAALRGHAPVAEYLVAQGADVNAKNGAGETPLQVAQRAGRSEVVRVLTKSGS
jgi:ankyrin repeat protein